MKRWIVSFGLIVIIIGAAWIMYVKHPRTIDIDLAGVKYQLGSEGAKSGTAPATVVIKGKLYTNLKGERVFKGEVQIVGEQIPVPKDQRKLEIHFAKDGWGVMAYPFTIFDEHGEQGSRAKTEIYQSHILFAKRDFSQVTFLILTPIQKSNDNNEQKSWNADNGFVFSAPAATRDEALAISNKLMRDYLNTIGKSLK